MNAYANQNAQFLSSQSFEFQFAESVEKMLELCYESSLEQQKYFVQTVFENGYVKEGTYSILKQLMANVIKLFVNK